MKYSLIITQGTQGESNTVAVDAEGEFVGGKLILGYTFDGAEYKLEICENAMAQNRDGEVKLHMQFIDGKTTNAWLFEGQSGGAFPVCTKKLDVCFDGADCKVECEFSYGACGETVNLSVSASVLQ
ncbi:MAG: DUF1934 domain-containing protein [Clostridia bacterium]|nr:DUF1934 domain-containing protein [Clostridia bacterium]